MTNQKNYNENKKYLMQERKRRAAKQSRSVYHITIGSRIENMLVELFEQQDEGGVSRVFSDAIRFAYLNNMYDPRRFEIGDDIPKNNIDDSVQTEEEKRKFSNGRAASNQPRQSAFEKKLKWCEEFGGVIDENDMCKYDKYEIDAAGVIRKNVRSQLLRVIPAEREEIRKQFIGTFTTLRQAESAYEQQELERQQKRNDAVEERRRERKNAKSK